MRKHCLSANHRDAILWTNASSGAGNSSAQTVDDHVLVNGRVPASEALREGWSEAEVCAEELAAPQKPLRRSRSAEAAPLVTMGQCRARETSAREQKLIAFGVLDDNGLDGV